MIPLAVNVIIPLTLSSFSQWFNSAFVLTKWHKAGGPLQSPTHPPEEPPSARYLFLPSACSQWTAFPISMLL